MGDKSLINYKGDISMDDEKRNEDGRTIGDMMDDVIAKGLENLEQMEVGSDEWVSTAKTLNDMTNTYTNFLKIECEYNDRQQQRNHELEIKKLETDTETRNSLIGLGIQTLVQAGLQAATLGTYRHMYMTNLKCAYVDDKYVLDKMFNNLPGNVTKMLKS